MKQENLKHLNNLIENRDRIKSVFSWDGGLLNLACAGIYTMKDKIVDEKILEECKGLLKKKAGVFSNFRSTARSPIAAMMAVSENPEQELENGLHIHEMLKEQFSGSTYLPITAMILAEMAQPSQYRELVERTRVIYKRMKSEHPFLTSGEDSAFCALMALSNKSDDILLQDAEDCYRKLKGNFFSSNDVQSLSHVLALSEGNVSLKCERTMDLFDKLKQSGHKYGTGYELPTLGVLAMSNGNLDEMVCEMAEMEKWLSKQKGFGLFGSISGKQRLMYAGMLAQKEYIKGEALQTAAVNGTISSFEE